MLGLLAIFIQTKQSADSNVIGAFTARQQFLLADCDRLEHLIQDMKKKQQYDKALFDNMVAKKKRQFEEAKAIDKRLKNLLDSI